MDQNPLAFGHPGEVVQSIMSRQECDWNGCGLFKAEVIWLRYHEGSISRCKSTEAGWSNGNNLVAYLKILHACADSGNLASALSSKRYRFPRIDTHGLENVSIVEARCMHLDLDLTGTWFVTNS